MEKIILSLPVGTLRKVSYAWFGVVALFPWSPPIAALLGALLLLSLVLVNLQNRIWERRELQEATGQKETPYVDHPRLPWLIRLRNLALAALASGVVAYLLGGQLGLTGLQWFLIFSGFFVLQMDLRLFGAAVVYILSSQGLAIRHADTRVFLHYNEIRSIAHLTDIKKPSPRWSQLTPGQSVKEGLLLAPQNRQGFTRLLDQILIAPTDIPDFLKRLPPRIKVEQINADM
jgi:hypothetical protein